MSSHILYQLPPELMIWILKRVETPRDLSALIKTSKLIYDIFKRSRNAILAAVIENAMPDGNFFTAIAACEALKISKLWCTNKPVLDAREDFFRDYSTDHMTSESNLHDTGLLRSLYRLWWETDYFASQFEQYALRYAASRFPALGEVHSGAANTFAKSRLQRAFYRFELFRRLHPTRYRRSRTATQKEYDQVRLFLEQFPPWEREEMLSVQEFLVAFAQNIVKDTMDYIVRVIFSAAQNLAVKPGVVFEKDPVRDLSAILDLGGYDIFLLDEPSLCLQRFKYFVGRGLPFLKWLEDLPPNNRISALTRYASSDWRPTLVELLSYWFEEFNTKDAKPGLSNTTESTKSTTLPLQRPGIGWVWADDHGITGEEDHLLLRYGLRRMGYVFWDIQNPSDSLLAEFTATISGLEPRSIHDEGKDWLEENDLSIQTRFRKIQIPEGALECHDITEGLNGSKEWEEMLEDGWPEPYSDKEAKVFNIEY